MLHPPVQQQQPEEDAAQAASDRKNLTLLTIKFLRLSGSRHRLSPHLVLDSRRSSPPSSHPNSTIRSRDRSMPPRSTSVGNIPSAQMETRSQNGPPPTKSSHDTGSAPMYISKRNVASRRLHRQSSQSLGPSTAARRERRRR